MKGHTIFSLFVIAFVIICISVMLNGCEKSSAKIQAEKQKETQRFQPGQYVKIKMTGERGMVLNNDYNWGDYIIRLHQEGDQSSTSIIQTDSYWRYDGGNYPTARFKEFELEAWKE